MECASLFSGCGGSDEGMKMAGFSPVFGVEYDQKIGCLYRLNHGSELKIADILSIQSIPKVDLVWVSPPCPSFSIANMKRGETEWDIQLACHVAGLVIESSPDHIAIENVPGYLKSQSCAILQSALLEAGYQVHSTIYNAADFGVPQTRKRLILRASRGKIKEIEQSHCSGIQLDLYKPQWVNWSDRIIDFSLTESILTDNQKKVLSDQPIDNLNLLIERTGYRGKPKTFGMQPAPTIRSHVHYDDRQCYRTAYNIIRSGQCFKADIKCLAAWQSFPPNYIWGDCRTTAAKAIGNAVPPLLSKVIAQSFLE